VRNGIAKPSKSQA